MLRSIGKQSGESVESVRNEKKTGYSGKDLRKGKVSSLVAARTSKCRSRRTVRTQYFHVCGGGHSAKASWEGRRRASLRLRRRLCMDMISRTRALQQTHTTASRTFCVANPSVCFDVTPPSMASSRISCKSASTRSPVGYKITSGGSTPGRGGTGPSKSWLGPEV